MDTRLFFTVFATIFLAELGDKTQLATILYAADSQNSRLAVFFAAALALVVSAALGVLAGSLVSQHLNRRVLSWIAGAGFITIGIWTLARA